VGNRADPGETTALSRRQRDDLASGRPDVELRALGVVHAEPVQGKRSILAERPLIGPVQGGHVGDAILGQLHEAAGDCPRLRHRRLVEDLAVVGEHRRAADVIRRAIHDRQQPCLAAAGGLFGGFRRTQPDPREIERRHAVEP
jgi:hypothetical protein